MFKQPVAKTPSERAVVALNSLTHGATAKTLFLEGEDPDEFFVLLEDAFQHHQPTCRQDSDLVTDTVLARWFLSRRQRIYLSHEAWLYARKPAGQQWISADVEDVERLDRYVTNGSRALTRALNNVRHIRKEAQSDQRWQAQHELQKERFTLQRERFELAKQKEERLAAKREAKERKQQEKEKEPEQTKNTTPALAVNNDFPPISELVAAGLLAPESQFQQTLFIGFEDDAPTVIYEVTPSNEEIRQALSEEDKVTRVYNFVGGVPPEYKHLITPMPSLGAPAPRSVNSTQPKNGLRLPTTNEPLVLPLSNLICLGLQRSCVSISVLFEFIWGKKGVSYPWLKVFNLSAQNPLRFAENAVCSPFPFKIVHQSLPKS